MPVSAEWDNESQTIIRIRIDDPWDLDEYSQATLHAWSLMQTVDYSVHLIIDLTDTFTFPKNLLSAAPTINSHVHPRQGLVIGVKISPYLQAVMRVAIRVFPRLGQNVLFTQTLQEAYALIQRHNPDSQSG